MDDRYIVRKVTNYRDCPTLISQLKSLFIYTVWIPKKGFYSATITSTLPFWRKQYTEEELLAATNLALTAAFTTIDVALDGLKTPKQPDK